MSSNIYDNDCSIIKQPVTIDEFRKEIDLLKEEIANLKKDKTNFIIDLVDFDEIDRKILLFSMLSADIVILNHG